MKNVENLYAQFMSYWKLNDTPRYMQSPQAQALTKTFAYKASLWGVAFLLFEIVLMKWVDRPLAEYTRDLYRTSPDFVEFFSNITDIGKAEWYLWPCGIATIFCAFLSRGKDVLPAYRRLFAYIGVRSLFVFSTVVFSGIVANIIKLSIGRTRPLLWLRDGIFDFDPLTRLGYLWNSMPSGHTTTAFAFAFSMCTIYPRLRWLWLSFAALLGVSRIMIDAHYLSDVLAGCFLAWISVRFFLRYGMFLFSKVIFPIDNPSHKV